jgi:hypothetical protein
MKNNSTYIGIKNKVGRSLPLIFAVIVLALSTACSRENVKPEESALYKHYASQPELSVAQVCGFRLCDTVRVDVVMLHAESDEAWQRLKDEYGLEGTEGVESWLGDSEQPSQHVKWNGEPVLRAIASHSRRTMAFYSIDTEAQYDALLDYQLKEIKN